MRHRRVSIRGAAVVLSLWHGARKAWRYAIAATIKLQYGTALTPTVTALNGLASSSSFLSGWTSDWIDNTSVLALDYLISAAIVSGTTPTAGSIRVYAYAEQPNGDDPDLFSSGTEGTQGAVTIHDAEQLDASFVLLWSSSVDTTTDQAHPMPPRSIAQAFGQVPRKFAIYIAHDTVAALKTTLNVLYADPTLEQSV